MQLWGRNAPFSPIEVADRSKSGELSGSRMHLSHFQYGW